MTDMITERDEVYGWETILARPVTPEEGEYRTAQREADDAWKKYYQACDRVEANSYHEDTSLFEAMAFTLTKAQLADDKTAVLYAVWMHSDSEYQNLRYLATHS